MSRILLDQGLPRSTAKILKEAGWDIIHTGEIGLSVASDREIIEYARENEMVVVTLDSDFHAILAVENAKRPSVIRIRMEGLKGNALANLIQKIWPKISAQVESGALITVTENAIRIKKIPIADEK